MPCLVYLFAGYQVLAVPAIYIFNLDPLDHILGRIKMSYNSLNICTTAFRVFIGTVSIFECSRLFPFTFLLAFSFMRMFSTIFESLGKPHRSFMLRISVFEYLQTLIIYSELNLLAEYGVVCMMSVALFSNPVIAFVSIRMHHTFPFWFYIIFPIFNIFIFIFVSISFYISIDVRNKSKALLRIWKTRATTRFRNIDRVILQKKLKSMRILQLSGGINDVRFFSLDNKIKVKYFDKIVLYTINLLLLVSI